MKEVRELAGDIAAYAKASGSPAYRAGAKRLELFASALQAAGLLPLWLDEHLGDAGGSGPQPGGISLLGAGFLTFPLRSKQVVSPALKARVSEEERDQTRYPWRWDEQEKKVKRTGRQGEPAHIYLDRLVLERKLGRALRPDEFVLYLDGDRANLQRSNLQLADPREMLWMQKRRHSVTGLKGVRPAGKKFQAQVWDHTAKSKSGKKGKMVHLGMYETAVEAAAAVDEAERRIRGFSRTRLNFPDIG